MAHILIIDGHPDPAPERFIHALAAAYHEGAQQAGHEVRTIRVAELEFPLLRTREDYERGEAPQEVRFCQAAIDGATHVVIMYPLWLGDMPALLKALLEQTLRPGFAYSVRVPGRAPVKLQAGKSARIVVTMGMPAPAYRWYYRAHSLRSLKRNILRFIGFRRVRTTLIGGITSLSAKRRARWLEEMRLLGQAAS